MSPSFLDVFFLASFSGLFAHVMATDRSKLWLTICTFFIIDGFTDTLQVSDDLVALGNFLSFATVPMVFYSLYRDWRGRRPVSR